MIGIYFSGTGYTKYCVERFVKCINESNKAVSIETPDIIDIITKDDVIVFGYPIYYSRLPGIVKDFILKNKNMFRDKMIFIISTQGIFSGDDSAGCSARLFRKCGGKIIGGLHLKMPNNTGDDKRFLTGAEECKKRIKNAEEKILVSANRFNEGRPTKEGLGLYRRFIGFFSRIIQKLIFFGKTDNYMKMPNVRIENCVGCGLCKKVCPMQNIGIKEGKAIPGNKCTLCYRCINYCPGKALTILGKKIYIQNRFDKVEIDGFIENLYNDIIIKGE